MTSAPEHLPLDVLLGDAARTLSDHRDDGPEGHSSLLRAVVDAAARTVPGADEAGVCLLDGRGTVSTVAASDPAIAEIDRVQSVLGEGPCLDALTTRDGSSFTRVPDLDGAPPPWRRWGPTAREAGFAGVLSYPLTGARFAGALTVYSRVPHALGPDAELVGGLFADQAAAVLHGVRRVSPVGRALAGRELIGRAKGILAERFGLTDPEAFVLISESAREAGLALRDVAVRVVEESDRRAAAEPRSLDTP